jgi:hypothetical protein
MALAMKGIAARVRRPGPPAVDRPLRLLKAEIDAYSAGERTRLVAALPEDMYPHGYLQ